MTRTFLCFITLAIALSSISITAGLKKHLPIGEACGSEHGYCSANQGLHCDSEKQVCVCPEGAEWVQEHEDKPHLCRIVPGQKCSRLDATAPQCIGNYHCVPDTSKGLPAEGAEVGTICMCSGIDHACESLDLRGGTGHSHSDGPTGKENNHHSVGSTITSSLVKNQLSFLFYLFTALCLFVMLN